MSTGPTPSASPRYSRQVLFPPIGVRGQERLLGATVVQVGAGALGATLAEILVRSGVGRLVIIDRDIVETTNLGRQAVYTTEDAEAGRPKATALRDHLHLFNPEVRIDAVVSDLHPGNARDLVVGADLLLDATDNFDARYLLNDLALETRVPWIYGACIGARGMTAVIRPGRGPCLRCLFPEPPPPGSVETCDTSGIIAPAATLVASLQAAEALKIIVGDDARVRKSLLSIELWPFRWVELGGQDPKPAKDCPACGLGRREFLDSARRARMQTLCGRDSVQVIPAERNARIDLEAVRARIARVHPARIVDGVLRIDAPPLRITLFDDGRALVGGTSEPAAARSLYDRIVGS